ncbi:MAG: septum formation protein Maf [bacterium]|nr:septum formation protein Maf [bacterium]
MTEESEVTDPISKPLVLASGSPRRRLLLSMAGFEFEVVSPDIEEIRLADEPPEEFVVRMAKEKAEVVAASHSNAFVLGFDTSVALGERVYGKPVDEDEAAEMLLSLAGRSHMVYTGFSLVQPGGQIETGIDAARVTMRAVSDEEAAAYAATGEPLDKAGAYALQGKGRGFVESVEGLRSTVIGLPLESVVDLLIRNGIVPTRM